MGELRDESVSNCGRQIDVGELAGSLNGAGTEAGWLTSLMEVLADHLGKAAEHLDPGRQARLGADLAQIARGCSERLSEQMTEAEERCCVLGRPCRAAG